MLDNSIFIIININYIKKKFKLDIHLNINAYTFNNYKTIKNICLYFSY